MDFQKIVKINELAIKYGMQSIRYLSLFLRIYDAGGEIEITDLTGPGVESSNREYRKIYFGLRQLMAGEAKRNYNGNNLIQWKTRGLIGYTAKGRRLAQDIERIQHG